MLLFLDGDEDEDEPLDRDLAVEVHNLEKQVSELSKRYNMARIAVSSLFLLPLPMSV